MTRSLHLLPLVLLLACKNKADDTGPVDDTRPTDTDTDTDLPNTDTGPPITAEEHCAPLGAATGATVVAPGDDIQSVVDAAAAGDVIALAAGTHTITQPIRVRTAGVTLRGETGDPADVVVETANAGAIVWVSASDVTIAGLTLTGAAEYGLLVEPVNTAVTNTLIDQVHVVDHGREHVLVRPSATGNRYPDGGEIRCSTVALTDDGRKDVVGLCETGGIHVQAARDWTIRDNLVSGFWCEFGASGFGIEVSEGSRDVLVERNVLEDVANGIALGVGNLPTGRAYNDAPCEGAVAQAFGGTVRNNSIWSWDSDLFESEQAVQVGIGLDGACESTVLHNTVYSREESAAAIQMRFDTTTGAVANNLTNGSVLRKDNAAAEVSTNIEFTSDLSFVHVQSGDLHLSPAADTLIGAADPAFAVDDDIDGEPRDGAPDIGADEHY